jgi:hypothetical protein
MDDYHGVQLHRPGSNTALDVPATGQFIPAGIWTGIAMARDTTTENTGETEDLEAVADRLEAALERIARGLDAPRPGPVTEELTARLEGLIERLRAALGQPHA